MLYITQQIQKKRHGWEKLKKIKRIAVEFFENWFLKFILAVYNL